MSASDNRFLDRLSMAGRAAVEQAADLRHFRSGEALCRKGDAGRGCLVIVSGGVVVEVERGVGGARRIFLGPGQIIGEMSLLSGNPVTATVIAAVDTEAYVIPRRAFLELVDREPAFRDALFGLLIERMRHREMHSEGGEQLPCTLIVTPRDSRGSDRLCEMLFRAVEHYAPGSVFVDTRRSDRASPATADRARPQALPASDEAVTQLASPDGPTRVVTSGGPAWCSQLLEKWRAGGGAGRTLCLVLTEADLRPLAAQLGHGDLVLVVHAPEGEAPRLDESRNLGLVGVDHVCLGGAPEPGPEERWYYRVPNHEIEGDPPPAHSRWDRLQRPVVDWLARRITGREIGVAFGAGGAGGFAHFGVVDVLERAGIGVDYACGASMGGVLALAWGKTGSAEAVIELAHQVIDRNERVRDLTMAPRSALLRGAKRRQRALEAMGDTTFTQLSRPTAVVCSDLVRSERYVFEKGSARLALLATSAIPGIFPPESHDGRLLLDGAVVSRVPVDLLERRRCGLKIAVNVVDPKTQSEADYARTAKAFDRLFGLTRVITESWNLLTWWHGAVEAGPADILLEPRQARHSGFDLSTLEEMMDAGRDAATEKLEMIQDAVSRLLRPGAP
jgi:NTE family protein